MIMRYLIGTTINYSAKKESTQGIIFRPDKTRSVDDYLDVFFDGEWNTE